jgi:DNA repair protein RadC
MEVEMLPITQWPMAERPRERLLAQGPQSLSDAELLAIFLRTGIPGKTAVDLARELLSLFGGLRPLLMATRNDFCRHKGLGDAKYAQLQAVLEMARRHLAQPLQTGEVIRDPNHARQAVHARLRDYPYEVFAVLFLDNRHRVLAFEEMFRGTIDGASVPIREVVASCLKRNAAAVILAHNHPSGVAEPSHADCHLTEQMGKALQLVGVRILDHLVVGDQGCTSFAERGLLHPG